jgi:hypothetical protein
MQTFGFGHRDARHLIVEKNDELWLAAAPTTMGGLFVMGPSALPGTMRIEPLTDDGQLAKFDYTATESRLDLTAGKATLRFAIDAAAGAVRIEGDCALRLNATEAAMFSSSLRTRDGIVVSLGAMRYLFAVKRGKVTFDDTWLLAQFHSVTPVLTIEPEDGAIEVVAYDLPADTTPPAITKTLDECAVASAESFAAFSDTLVDVSDEYADVKQKIAYAMWISHRVINGVEVIVENKYRSANTNSRLMASASLAFKDVDTAVRYLLALPIGEAPPIVAIAAAQLLPKLNDARGTIFRVYSAFEASLRWWQNNRTLTKDGLAFYAYRYENTLVANPAYFSVGEPVFAPDLNAYLILAAHVCGELAALERDAGMGAKWTAYAAQLAKTLVYKLWDEGAQQFVGENAYTGERSGADAVLSNVPIILEDYLPQALLDRLSPEEFDVAQEAENIRADGVTDAFYGAKWLTLASRELGVK